MWENIKEFLPYLLLLAVWLDSRRRDNAQLARIAHMENVVRGFEEERQMLKVALAGIGDMITEKLKPLERHLIEQDRTQREIMSIAQDTRERIANHTGARTTRQ